MLRPTRGLGAGGRCLLRMLRPTRGLGTVAGGEKEAKAMSYKVISLLYIILSCVMIILLEYMIEVHNAMDPS